jgi:AcrR family transcriptional regulator
MAKRDNYHHGRLRDELVDQAEELIDESGAHSWSMREAARRLGVSQAAPYRHFSDKAALIDAVVLRGYGQLEERYRKALRRCRGETDRVISVAMAYYQFGVDKPELFSLMFSSPRLHVAAEALQSYQVFEDEVAAAQERRELAPAPARDQTHALWGVAHGVAQLVNREVFGPHHGKKVARLALAATIRGLGPERAVEGSTGCQPVGGC